MPRWIAALLAGALVALGFVVSITPATAALPTPGDVTGGTATWGLSTYLNAGSFGRPSPLTGAYIAPAAYDSTTKLTSWGNATGHVNANGSATLAFAGTSVNFTATGGGWLKFADVQASLDPTGNGSVTALVSYGLAPGTYPNIAYDASQAPQRGPERVTIVTLAGNTSGATLTDTSASWSGLVGTWDPAILAYLQGDGATIPAWAYSSSITNDATVAGPRTALPFAFAVAIVPPAPTFTPTTYNAGSATWGISTYLNAGNFGRPSPLTAGYVAPASYDSTSKLSTWGNATGTINADGSAALAFSGTSVNFTATGGGWLKLTDPQATIDASGNGTVTAVVSYGLAPGVYPNITYSAEQAPQRGPERVEIVALANNAVSPTQTSTAATWTGLAGTWDTDFLAYLQGNGSTIPAWTYSSAITNDATVAGPRTVLPFTFSLNTVPLIATTTTLTAAPATSVLVGADIALTATVSPALPGNVEFRNGSQVLATVPVTAGTASYTLGARTIGANALTATFVPTDSLHYAGSTGAATVTVNAPVPAAAGSLTWGVKQSLQTYVLGGGSISTSSGAGANGSRFTFPQASSAGFDHAGAVGSSGYSGKVTFAYPLHGFSIALANPRVQLSSATAGTLFVDVTYNGATTPNVAFASLGLGSATKTTTGTSSTFSNVSAILTAAGAASFAGFYSAGDALDSMSFVVGSASSAFAPVSKSTPKRVPAETAPATEGVEFDGSSVPTEGGEFSAWADGYAANEQDVLVVIYSSPMLLGTTTADETGRVQWTGTLPEGLTGEHTLTFQGSVNRGIVLDIQPAAVTTTAVAGCLVDDATITWGFKESFRSYISGSIANGEWTVADGATYEVPNFGWADGTGAYEPSDSTGELAFAGSITFTGHGGVLNTTVANPTVRFLDADTAFIDLDVSGTTQDGTAVSQTGVEFVELDLTAATVETASDGTVTITDAPAVLTDAGAAAFGTYETGEAFDPVTLVFSTDSECGAEDAAAPATTTPVDAEPTSSDFSWLLWVLLALVVIIAAVVVIIIVRRRSVSTS